MNTNETDQKNTIFEVDSNIKSKQQQNTDKPNKKTISKSTKIKQILNENKIFAPIETCKEKTAKKLITTNHKQHQQQKQQRQTSSLEKRSTLSVSSSSSPSSTSSLATSSSTFKSLSQSVIEYRDSHRVAVNVCFTNTDKANQLNLQTTAIATMPTRTTTKVKIPTIATSTTEMTKNLVAELNSMKLSTTKAFEETPATKKTSSNIMSSTKASVASQKSSTPLTLPFRRSYSVPILKLDDVTRQRVNSISARVECDKRNSNLNPTSIIKTTSITTPTKTCNYKNGANQENRLTNHRLSESDATSSVSTTTTATTTMTAITKTIEIKPSATDAGDMSYITTTDHDYDDDHDHDGRTQCIREDLRFGCAHYKRRAMFVTPCCNKFYKCRFCHDENETHHFDRKTLNELICSECNTRQKVQEACINCGVRFGKYICLICNLFDDEDKKQYHCDACGICRIGGAENFFHCEVCNMCLPIQLKIDGHKCVENISRSHCPVCLGDIHTSRIPCHIPDCGHLLHKMCFDQLLASGHYACPTCQTSLIDMTALWDFLDAQALQMPMPKKYENQRIHIFCNDCHRASKTNFHFIGLKCIECGAYNTTQDVKRRVSLVPDETNTA